MPAADPQVLLDAMKLPPEEAIAFFKAKGYQITWNWHEMKDDAHARAFTVAKAASLDILKDIRGVLQKALDQGITQAQFAKELTPRLQAKGWWGQQEVRSPDGEVKTVQLGSPWRLKTIFQTNLQSAYMAGRERQMRAVADARPYWKYIAILDGKTRPEHRELHGKVFRFDDPLWAHFYPPNGYNCRCRVTSLSPSEAARDGVQIETSAGKLEQTQAVDEVSGRVFETTAYQSSGRHLPIHPDEGFDSNPARAQDRFLALLEEKRRAAEEALGEPVPDLPDRSEEEARPVPAISRADGDPGAAPGQAADGPGGDDEEEEPLPPEAIKALRGKVSNQALETIVGFLEEVERSRREGKELDQAVVDWYRRLNS